MATRTRFLFLMHPKEWREKAATGRLTHLCLTHSELHTGIGFDGDEAVQARLRDPRSMPFLLYPAAGALNLSAPSPAAEAEIAALRALPANREIVIVILDATWALARKMLKLSPSLQRLPRLMFTPSAPSRYVIKQQPHPACLSTLEAAHEVLLALERAGLDAYPQPEQLPALFARMQAFQLRCASDPAREGYRHHAYRPPAERKPPSGRSGTRRTRMFEALR